MNKIKSWSLSRIHTGEQCMFKYKCKHIDKLKDESYNMQRGTDLHKMAESYVKGAITGGVPRVLQPFKAEIKQLRLHGAETEVDLTVDSKWKPTHAKDWDNAWCRGNADAVLCEEETATVVDYKSGKIYEDKHRDQADLYATLYMSRSPEVATVDVELWYFDIPDIRSYSFSSDNLKSMQKVWTARSKKLLTAIKFSPTPGDYCRYCAYSARKGGPCVKG